MSNDSYERGRLDERAAIVEWLYVDTTIPPNDADYIARCAIAERIERGEYREASE